MAEPVSATAASAVAATAVATGGSAGAMSAGAATGAGTSAAAGGAAAGTSAASTGAGAAAGIGGAPGAAGLAAPAPVAHASAPAAPAAATPLDLSQMRWTESAVPAETVPAPEGFTGQQINMPGTHFQWTRETDKTGAGSSAGRAMGEEPARRPTPPAQPQAEAPSRRDPTAPVLSRPEAVKPQRAGPEAKQGAQPRLPEPAKDAPTAEVRACQETRPIDRIHPRDPGEQIDHNDPHEQEREALNRLLERYDVLTEREKERLRHRLVIWDWRQRDRKKDRTLVIGPHGMDERWRYEETKKRREDRERMRQQMEMLRAIAQGNPLSASVGLYVYVKTGNLEAATNTTDALSGVTGGGRRGGKTAPPRAMQPPRGAPPPRMAGPKTGKKGGPKEKVPAGKTSPPPPKKLTARQRELRQEVQRLNDAIKDDRSRRGKTIAILVVEKNGKREVWVTSSQSTVPPEVRAAAKPEWQIVPGSSSPAGNKDLPKDRQVSYHHAEHDGIHVAVSNGYKVVEIYPSRPACSHCSGFREMGYTILDPE